MLEGRQVASRSYGQEGEADLLVLNLEGRK